MTLASLDPVTSAQVSLAVTDRGTYTTSSGRLQKSERPVFNIRIAGPVQTVVIKDNVYMGDSTPNQGDRLIYDTKSFGTVIGTGTTFGNQEIH